ncbi:hypothetical protein GCM10023116_13010 [Kistimonas scapharcae]|uniref:Uncharacterized protein n=1 Tax=Kistimonas scapharcae TaxID=1036133 RepID=A0ABP8UZJ3_9GAMM
MNQAADIFTITETGAAIIGAVLIMLIGILVWIFKLILNHLVDLDKASEAIQHELSEHKLEVAKHYATRVYVEDAMKQIMARFDKLFDEIHKVRNEQYARKEK